MPYYKRVSSVETEPFVQRILAVLREEALPYHDSVEIEGSEPLVIEEDGFIGKLRVTVVWDEWSRFSADRRRRIAEEAYFRRFGSDIRSRLGLVSGMTKAEFEIGRAKGQHQSSQPRQVAKGEFKV